MNLDAVRPADGLTRPGVPTSVLTRRFFWRTTLYGLLFLTIFVPSAVTAGLVRAQEPQPVSGRIEAVDDSEFPAIRAIVTLVDASGRPIAGLTASDFVAEESGAEADVSSVETVLDQQLGVAVILVIDTSGSMEGAPLDQARNAARTFVENLAEPDEAAVISFAEGVSTQSRLSADRAQTLQALDSLAAVGNTALYSGVVEAVRQAEDAALPRKAIILLSDGQDFGGASQASRQEALNRAAEAGVPVYAIGLGLDIDRPFLEELADASSGAFIEAPAPGSIPAIYDQLSQLLRSQYVVTIESSAPANQMERNLRLTVRTPEDEVELTSDYATSRTIIIPTETAPPTAVPTATVRLPILSPANAEPTDESGGGLLLPLVVVVLGVAGLVVGVTYYRRAKRRREYEQRVNEMSQRAAQELDLDETSSTGEAASGPTRRVTVIGPDGEETFEIGHEPLTIGTSSECQIKLEPAAGVAGTHARCWLREGTLMLHHLARSYQTIVGGVDVTWVSLATGDEAIIGPYRLRVDD